MYWHRVSHVDWRARWLADDHYSRQTPGATEFTPPGNKIVLIVPHPSNPLLRPRALWASQRLALHTTFERADGYDCWNNVIFRNESDLLSSNLIIQAMQATRYFWQTLPRDGFHTFVDPDKVRGVKVRGEVVKGFCFMKAGFELYPERTKSRALLRWIYPPESLKELAPTPPANYPIPKQLSLPLLTRINKR